MSAAAEPSPSEFSVIGALLQRPYLVPIVARWLQSSDFADPWMARIFHALVEQELYRHPEVTAAGPKHGHPVLARLVLPQMQANAAAAGEVVPQYYWEQLREVLDLHLVSPVVTEDPDAALTYGRGVLWDKVRRTVRSGGEMLAAAAATYAQGMAGVSLAASDGIGEIADLRRRWEDATPARLTEEPSEQLPLVAGPVPRNAESDLLLATLVLNPSHVGPIRSFIQPKHFGGDYSAEVYEQVLAAADLGVSLAHDQPLMMWALQVRAMYGCTDAGTSRSEVRHQATAVFRQYVRHVAAEGGSLLSQWASQGVGATRQVLGAAQRVFSSVARGVAESQRDLGLAAAAGGFGYRASAR